MSYPPGKKKDETRLAHVGGVVEKSIGMKIIAHVIEGHDDHNDAA